MTLTIKQDSFLLDPNTTDIWQMTIHKTRGEFSTGTRIYQKLTTPHSIGKDSLLIGEEYKAETDISSEPNITSFHSHYEPGQRFTVSSVEDDLVYNVICDLVNSF